MKIIQPIQTSNNTEVLTAEQAFADMLNQHEWDLFCTFTYSEAVWSSEKVERDLKRTFKLATAKQLGVSPRNWRFKKRYSRQEYAPWLIAIEKHKNGTLHAHALIGVRTPSPNVAVDVDLKLDRRIIKEVWQQNIRHAGFTKIEKIRKNKRGVKYMIKSSRYCTKDSDAILEWHGLVGWNKVA